MLPADPRTRVIRGFEFDYVGESLDPTTTTSYSAAFSHHGQL